MDIIECSDSFSKCRWILLQTAMIVCVCCEWRLIIMMDMNGDGLLWMDKNGDGMLWMEMFSVVVNGDNMKK